jgi:integrase/recombinase XerD
VLSVSEVERVLNQVDPKAPLGLRDRAILETLYATGMRRMELLHLHCYDLDSERGTVLIRQGKGRKDRLLPIGARAIAWIEQYLDRERPLLVNEPDDGTLFLTHRGDALSGNRLSQLVAEYVAAAQLGKEGSCHLFRHTMATLMLEHGADIRFVQQMLGHAQLSTTEVYTQVSIRALQAVYAATHPGAHLRRGESEHKAAPVEDTLSEARRVAAHAQAPLCTASAAEAAEESD